MGQYVISKEVEFDAGHRVPNHASKCRNPHGHRYRVRVSITGDLVTTPGASNEGMLADFGDLKNLMMQLVHDPLDHGFIVYEHDDAMASGLQALEQFAEESFKVVYFPYIPTAENLAQWVWDELKTPIDLIKFELALVEVWETPTSLASYTG
jgi:6-pyruvoyltetrahydropterin/6-carboxytetrahydropterin synthase